MTEQKSVEHGIVKVFFPLKGYGFIQRPKGKDVFVMFDDILDDDTTFVEGASVSFTIESAPKGPRAKNVRIKG